VELGLRYGGPPRTERAEPALVALERVGLGHRTGHRPAELSGGEQQRVAIARAVVREQRFLLADEPTGNLDSRTAGAVLDLLDSFVDEGRTVVCATHSAEVASRAHRCLTVLDGILTPVD
jgi:putative ABC transport system ATP-binding protein